MEIMAKERCSALLALEHGRQRRPPEQLLPRVRWGIVDILVIYLLVLRDEGSHLHLFSMPTFIQLIGRVYVKARAVVVVNVLATMLHGKSQPTKVTDEEQRIYSLFPKERKPRAYRLRRCSYIRLYCIPKGVLETLTLWSYTL